MPGCEGFPAFLLTRKGLVMVAEMLTIFIAVVCQAVSGGCYITVPIAELVLLIIMFVVFVKELYATYGTVNWYWTSSEPPLAAHFSSSHRASASRTPERVLSSSQEGSWASCPEFCSVVMPSWRSHS
ncbi:uncharacterized protein LOC114798688 isoform X2 [Denticeps clupeoides]|uniref:uncharacterized protein LOC114798688 isoform X2 n=1 Tax=Denticeps clupeoides TaxID=299321 RepID=UPI0010A42A62|nr:uncharacterized protein LOC114798688 isoform X2 [Denticeps clupeoides]